MKNDDEMYESLLSRYEVYQEQQQKQKRIIQHTIPVFVCFCFTVVLGLGIWNQRSKLPDVPVKSDITETTSSETATTASSLNVDAGNKTTAETTAAIPQTMSWTATERVTSSVEPPKETSVIREAGTQEQTASVARIQTAGVTETVQSVPVMTALPTVTSYEGNYGTIQLRSTDPVQTTASVQVIEDSTTDGTTCQTTSPTEKKDSKGGLGVRSDAAESTDTSVKHDTPYPGEPGFQVRDEGNAWVFTAVCNGDAPGDFSIPYVIDNDRFQILYEELEISTETRSRVYQLCDTETHRYFSVTQFLMQDFQARIESDDAADAFDLCKSFSVTDSSGFIVPHKEYMTFYSVYWTDGKYIMFMVTDDARLIHNKLPDQFHAAES